MLNKKLLTVVIAAALAGCGGSTEKYVPVTGAVVLDGQPLARVNVMFEPLPVGKEDPPGKFSVGQTDDQGRFTLKSPLANRDGAAVGKHRIRIVTPSDRKFTQRQIDETRNKMIAQAKQSGNASAEITEASVLGYLSESSPSTFVEPIPARYNQQTELQFEVSAKQPNDARFEIQSK